MGTYPSSCSGASDPDYTITYTAGSVVIGAAPLVIMASSVATTYGTAATAIAPSYSGFLNGDTAASLTTKPTCGSAATVTTGVGVYPSTCSGASDPNYSITYVNGKVTISPAPITITASSDSMIYGGSVPDIIPTVDGLQNNEGSSVLGTGLRCSTTATSVANVGSYKSSCSGGSDPNYSITYVAGSVSVTPAQVTVTASSDSMVYGGTVPTITPTVDGLQNGQDATVLGTGLTCSTKATPTSPIGSYKSSCSGGSDANYSIEYFTGTTSVTAAPLTITASSASMTYGGTPPTIVAQVAGLQNGETVSVLGPGLACTTSAVSSSPVIPSGYESTCSGAADNNYDLTYVAGTVTVTPAPLSITASSGTMSYGTTPPTITPIYGGLANGDTAPATPPSCATTATSSSPTGSYPSSCSGAADPNYDISYSNGSVTVHQATLIIVASSGSMSYGGTAPPITPTYEGLANGDTAPATPPTCTTTATSSSTVGTYPSSCSGAADPDYTIAYTNGTVSVDPAALTITASSASVDYGVAPPAITPIYVGLANGDTAPATPPTCTTTATSSSSVGSYPTTCSGASDPDYTINYNSGTVVVTPAPLSITASSETMSYGGTVPTITPTYVGLANGDTAPATPPTCITTATSSSPTGSYPSSCSGAADPNYQITYTGGQVDRGPVHPDHRGLVGIDVLRRHAADHHPDLRRSGQRRHRTGHAADLQHDRHLFERGRHLPEQLLGRGRPELHDRLHQRDGHGEPGGPDHHRLVFVGGLRGRSAGRDPDLRRPGQRRHRPGHAADMHHDGHLVEHRRLLPDHLLGRGRSELHDQLQRRDRDGDPGAALDHRVVGDHVLRRHPADHHPDLRGPGQRRHGPGHPADLHHDRHLVEPGRLLPEQLLGRGRPRLHDQLQQRDGHRRPGNADHRGLLRVDVLRRHPADHHPDLRGPGQPRHRTGHPADLHHDGHLSSPVGTTRAAARARPTRTTRSPTATGRSPWIRRP